MSWADNVARTGEMKNIHNILVGKPEGKRPLRRSKRKWEDNIRMVREIRWEGVECIHLGPVAGVVNTVMYLWIP
jgi:hypothetical protein